MPRRDAELILRETLARVHATEIVKHTCTRVGDGSLRLRAQVLRLPPPAHRTFIVTAGKAAASMARGLLDVIGPERVAGGVCVVADGYELPVEPLQTFVGAHPVPDERCVTASDAVLALLSSLGVTDLVLFGISGGGSSLLTAPPDGVSLADIQRLNELLLASGCDAEAFNKVRRHVSRTKGGNLLRAAGDARLFTLILSDTLSDKPYSIASGPTVPDPTTFTDGLHVLESLGLTRTVPPSVLNHLRRGAFGERRETLKRVELDERYHDPVILANHRNVRAHAVEFARAKGYNVHELADDLRGEAATLAEPLAALMRDIREGRGPVAAPACVIGTGETTVTMPSDTTGRGGRNQHLALATARHLAGVPGVAALFAGTDGRDGPTEAAGAVVSGETFAKAEGKGLDITDALLRFDSFAAHAALGTHVTTGPTHTNLLDLAVLLVK